MERWHALAPVDRWIGLGLLCLGLLITAVILVSGAAVSEDDGYYYFKIAQNLARGQGSTFDGLTRTNGYHPLWQLLLVPLFLVARNRMLAETLAIVLQGLLMSASVAALYLLLRRMVEPPLALGAGLLWTALAVGEAFSGVEFALHAFGIVLMAWLYADVLALLQEGPAPASTAALRAALLRLGLVSAGVMMARLETGLLAGLFGVSLLWHLWRRHPGALAWQLLAVFLLPLLVTGLVYLFVNWVAFGHPFPISGHVKRDWSLWKLGHDEVYRSSGWLAAKRQQVMWVYDKLSGHLWLVLLAGGPLALLLVPVLPRPVRRVWWPLAVFGLVEVLIYVAVYHGYLSYPGRYYVVQPLMAVALVAVLLQAVFLALCRGLRSFLSAGLSRRVPLLCGYAGASLLLVWTLQSVQGFLRRTGVPNEQRQVARWLEENTAPGTIVASWNAGAIGYWSDRRVVNLDGVVNFRSYFGRDQRHLCEYWKRLGVTLIVEYFDRYQAQSTRPTRENYKECAGRLELLYSRPSRAARGLAMKVFRLRAE